MARAGWVIKFCVQFWRYTRMVHGIQVTGQYCPVFIFDATYEEAGHEILHDQQNFVHQLSWSTPTEK